MDAHYVWGWLRENERLALRRWCFDQEVLELGAYEGLSTCNIAATAKGVVTVDTFDGRGTPNPKDTEAIFWENLQRCERSAPVRAHKGTFAEVLPAMDRKFDRIFIDGSHDYESVKQDIELCRPLLKPQGRIIFHDYDDGNPGVVKAVDEFVASGATPVAQADSLVMVQADPLEPVTPVAPKIVVMMPHRDGWANYGAVVSATKQATQRFETAIASRGHSILTLTFNQLWCEALNLRDTEGFTHAAMLHNDIVPEPGWLDLLMDEMVAGDFDFISALVPLKNEYGLTSTGTDTPGYPWGVRRLTMTEAMQLPETFTAQDVPHREQDACLLLNSGCWLIKLNEPWVKGLHFRQQDRIVKCLATNTWAAQSISEDWDFSRQLVSRGCRLACTRKVKLYHQWRHCHNQSAWGEWTEDLDFKQGQEETARLKAQLAGTEATDESHELSPAHTA